jgi:hypothetical protein
MAKQLGLVACDPFAVQSVCEQALQTESNDELQPMGINTSIVGIHKFLINFFKFYICNILLII